MRVPTCPLLAAPTKGRRPQNPDKVAFEEVLPLRLRNHVSGKGNKSGKVACIQEMSVLFACLKTNEFDQVVCSNEINNFQACYYANLKEKGELKEMKMKGLIVPGAKTLTHDQVNSLLKKFPHK